MSNETVSIRIRKDTYAKVQSIADDEHRPAVHQLDVIVAAYLAHLQPATTLDRTPAAVEGQDGGTR
jgi:hypothetical protein